MPIRNVYGKKARACMNRDVFGSSKGGPEEIVENVAKQVLKLAISDEDETTTLGTPRRALKTISQNICPVSCRPPHGKKRQERLPVWPNKNANATSKFEHCAEHELAEEAQQSETDVETQHDRVPVVEQSVTTSHITTPRGPRLDVDVEDPIQSHLSPILPFSASAPMTFDDFDAALSKHAAIRKIAEASFSQVFHVSPRTRTNHSRARDIVPSVLKLIPLTAPANLIPTRPTKLYAELMALSSKPCNVASEVRLLQHLTEVPGHTTFRALHLLTGRPGPSFSAAYKSWNARQRNAGKDTSFFPDPARKTAYGETQLWAVIEMADAGSDLERYMETDEWARMGVWAVWDVFWQVACAYAKGEVAAEWETRDGHCGNICVRQLTALDPITSTASLREGARAGDEATNKAQIHKRCWQQARRGRKMGYTGLEVTVIDYTISRASIPSSNADDEVADEVAYIDLDEDQALFEGDGRDEYQYDIYRHMRSAAFLDDPLAEWDDTCPEIAEKIKERSWKQHHPQTNVVWLHFVLHKLLEHHEWRDDKVTMGTNGGGDELCVREMELEATVRQLSDILKLENWHDSGLRSASDIVALAMRECWLAVDDVTGAVGEPDKARTTKRRTRKNRSD